MSIEPPADESPPLLQMLPLSSEAGAYSLPREHIEALMEAADELDLITGVVDLTDCRDKGELLTRIAQAMAFPDWFGHNWDALADCLADLGWLGEAAGYALIFDHAQDLRLASQDDYDTLIEILDEAAEGWREVDRPFWSFLCEGVA